MLSHLEGAVNDNGTREGYNIGPRPAIIERRGRDPGAPDQAQDLKVLVTGAGGQLGQALSEILPSQGHEAVALDRKGLDVTDERSVDAALEAHAPDVVVNAAAYTNVDGAEGEPELAYAVNALGPRNLAQACEARGVALLHVSTNYVFDGLSERPYEPFDPPNPVSVYGRTKLAGEECVRHLTNRHYVVRTAGVYGEGRNFVRTMLRVGGERDVVRVKDDEYVSPTYARDLAEGIAEVLESGRYGVYHLTNAGSCSWYEFTREIFALAGIETEVVPIPSSQYPLPAARPANGVLSPLGSPAMRHWREALEDYLRRESATQ
jgi:dTDP-4-dehydrorhamnose reductase